jgi:hypothetical protein
MASCATPVTSGSYFDPTAFFSPDRDGGQGVTFAWDQETVIGDPRLANNEFFEERLHEAVEWELSLRGFRRDDLFPRLLLHHHLTLADHELVLEGPNDPTAESLGPVSYVFEEGTVVVHLADLETGDDLWLGWAAANVEPALEGPDQMRTLVYRVVGEMFKDWPIPDRDEPRVEAPIGG